MVGRHPHEETCESLENIRNCPSLGLEARAGPRGWHLFFLALVEGVVEQERGWKVPTGFLSRISAGVSSRWAAAGRVRLRGRPRQQARGRVCDPIAPFMGAKKQCHCREFFLQMYTTEYKSQSFSLMQPLLICGVKVPFLFGVGGGRISAVDPRPSQGLRPVRALPAVNQRAVGSCSQGRCGGGCL